MAQHDEEVTFWYKVLGYEVSFYPLYISTSIFNAQNHKLATSEITHKHANFYSLINETVYSVKALYSPKMFRFNITPKAIVGPIIIMLGARLAVKNIQFRKIYT